MSNHEVVAANVARLRAERGITQAELADRADLSRVTLGKIERGEVLPRSDTLTDLARGLRVPVAELVTPTRPLPGVRFRAAKRVNTREQILAEIATWLDSYSWLEDQLETSSEFKLSKLVGSKADPVELAANARGQLRLDPKEPVRDICGLLEDSGVKLLLIRKATDSFFGLSVSSRGGGPAVVVNTWKRISVERWIFTGAHELGHILLHEKAYDRTRDQEDPEEEREADRFAAHFLMPEAGFSSEWDETRGLPLLDRVLKLKRIFRVSYKTVLHRLVESERESADVWKAFQVQHKRQFKSTLRKIDEPSRLQEGEFRLNWSSAGEPDALSPYDFVQDRLLRLVRQALENDVISHGRAAEILAISRTEMRELANAWAT